MRIYCIYDGRYLSDPDNAILFETCSTFREAMENKDEHTDNAVIVKMIGKKNGTKDYIITEKEVIYPKQR